MQELTPRQQEILEFIQWYKKQTQRSPTRIEIAERFDFSSANASYCHLVALEKRGAIKLSKGKHRGIKVLI